MRLFSVMPESGRNKLLILLFAFFSFIALRAQTSTPYLTKYTSSTFTKTIDLSKSVGTVAGSAGTTTSGGSTYTVPIDVPKGINGLQPNISLVYNSQSGNGIAGYGWNIAGLSAITRTGNDLYHDGKAAPVTYTNTDGFVLDGLRLNPVSGTNGANGTTYATEAESFANITSYGTSSNNPDWFKVVSKNGSVMEFGNTVDSKMLTDDGANKMMWRL